MTASEFKNLDQHLEHEWLASYGNPEIDFIYDGATDPVRWLESPLRIMCLLKEAHGGGQWNHAAGILKDEGLLRVGGTANQAVHYRMIEWLYAFESTLLGLSFNVEADRSENYPKARQTMLRSAWVNIKKADGIAYSDNGNLREIALRDGSFLRRQVALLAPRFVICGYTYGTVQDVLFPGAQKIAGTDFSYSTPDGLVVVDFYHPGRKSRESYSLLAEEAVRIANSLSSHLPAKEERGHERVHGYEERASQCPSG